MTPRSSKPAHIIIFTSCWASSVGDRGGEGGGQGTSNFTSLDPLFGVPFRGSTL